MSDVRYRTCPLCEATCGLQLDVVEGRVTRIRGDRDDVFSHGFLCPKGIALGEVHDDPDRLRTPLVREAHGTLRPASWDEAWRRIADGLHTVQQRHGHDAVAVYVGNPSVHSLAGLLYAPVLVRGLRTRNVYTASTVDQMPKHVACGLVFGDKLTIPIPDVDHTDLLLVLGADPLTSNGSLMTAPDMPGRLRALRARGGRLVVVDPRRSRTAEEADLHLAIVPGTDALLLAALATTLFEEGLVDLGPAAPHVTGVDDVRQALRPFTAEAVSARCGLEASAVRSLARELAAAPSAAVYGRIGTCTVAFGTVASWLVDVVNTLTGNLDRPGGAMFPLAAAGQRNATPGSGRALELGRWRSRVRGLGEVFGELPVACLAEELDTPGDGQVRALLTVAGNPALSTPDAARLSAALEQLELLVCVDLYVNETSRHADVVLPATSPLQRPHYDLAFSQLAIRNIARWSPPVLQPAEDDLQEWEVLAKLAGIAAGLGADADIDDVDGLVFEQVLHKELQAPGSRIAGRDPDELRTALAGRRGPERLLDLLLRAGPYGDRFGEDPDGLTFDRLAAAPHGIDLGPLQPRLPQVLRTPSGTVELAPPALLEDLGRMRADLDRAADGGLVLIGRRQLRSNNSWMHNMPLLMGGTNRCTAWVHPADAAAAGLDDGDDAVVSSAHGTITVPVEVTDRIRRGVVSIPHGWGHDADGAELRVASSASGANVNVLIGSDVDPLSGNAVLNGVRVELHPHPQAGAPRLASSRA